MRNADEKRPVAFEKCTNKQARLFNDVTRKTVADYCGISEYMLKRFEDGDQPVTFVVVLKIAEYFNIPIECFVPGA